MSKRPESSRSEYWVGIDIGGTFTDIVLYDAGKDEILAYKTPTPASTRAEAVLTGLRTALARHGAKGAEVVFLGHGTTVATNALLTREALPTAVLTTRGFGDVLEIRRQTRRNTFDYYADFPPPLVPRTDVAELDERMDAAGEVVVPLRRDEVAETLRSLVARGIRSVAVCFLHSYANPAHEREVGEIARACAPELLLSLSCDLVPEFREYERMSTTVINAFVRPAVSAYLSRLEEGVGQLGIEAPLVVVQGNGGLMSSETAKRQPVAMIRSGPAAGVAGAAFVADLAGQKRIITLDIGGTSADVSVFEGETPSVVRDWEVSTFPVKWTALDVRSIGAGGGSIAWVDSGGLLKVGPDSAGADPGPACYGRGGTRATVTDAHLVLGRIGPDAVLGDSLRVDSRRGYEAVGALAAQLGRPDQETAAGIIEIVNAAIAQEVHFICAEKGLNIRDYTLVAYGGAGPLHAAQVAEELGIGKVLVPYWPGLVCALGVLATVPKADFAMTHLVSLSPDEPAQADVIKGLFGELDLRAGNWLREQKIPSRAVRRSWSLDMRYRGQNYELAVDVPATDVRIDALVESFHRRHEEAYGYSSARGVVQCVHARLTIALEVDHPPLRQRQPVGGDLVAKGQRDVCLGRGHKVRPYPVYERDRIPGNSSFLGPAIIEQMDTTTLVLPGQRAQVDRWGNILLEFER
ncbi:MAG: hydantoinase/oxoprolinase family protein [Proteobacteria bacterium]|nr:hydantoinase/oxoprolinase family protein [Pseudomonadota bacterium]